MKDTLFAYFTKIKRDPFVLIYIIAIASGIATLGSLYYGFFGDIALNIQDGILFPDGGGLEPCTLCWYSRILMYPTFFISMVAIFKRDIKAVDYILPLSFLGIILSSYHYFIQKFPNQSLAQCSSNVPCTALQVDYWGVLTIPFLALCAYIVIFTCVLIQRNKNAKS